VVAKSSDVVVAELTFPDAVTLAWTVPRPTVAVRVVLAVAAEDPPKTESRAESHRDTDRYDEQTRKRACLWTKVSLDECS